MNKEMEAQAWLAFASAAVAGYTVPDDMEADDEELSDHICDFAELVADKMLCEFTARYGSKARSTSRTPAKRRRADDDDEDDE